MQSPMASLRSFPFPSMDSAAASCPKSGLDRMADSLCDT